MPVITQRQEAIIEFLREHPRSTATEVGDKVLRQDVDLKPQAYARPAGSALKRLLLLGVVIKELDASGKFVWSLSPSTTTHLGSTQAPEEEPTEQPAEQEQD